MLNKLKKSVFKANLRLKKESLIKLTWGNVSGIDRKKGIIAIKPSGVSYDKLKVKDIVLVDLKGKVVEGKYKPSSDTPTHIEIYKSFPNVNGVVHTHSVFATAFAQAGKEIQALGTTHADTFFGDVPCSRSLTAKEINGDYEKNTGKVIVETAENYENIPAVLVKNHGPFVWGKDVKSAVDNAVILEEVAKMNYLTLGIDLQPKKINKNLLDKHFLRKHGKDAYYGQEKGEKNE